MNCGPKTIASLLCQISGKIIVETFGASPQLGCASFKLRLFLFGALVSNYKVWKIWRDHNNEIKVDKVIE